MRGRGHPRPRRGLPASDACLRRPRGAWHARTCGAYAPPFFRAPPASRWRAGGIYDPPLSRRAARLSPREWAHSPLGEAISAALRRPIRSWPWPAVQFRSGGQGCPAGQLCRVGGGLCPSRWVGDPPRGCGDCGRAAVACLMRLERGWRRVGPPTLCRTDGDAPRWPLDIPFLASLLLFFFVFYVSRLFLGQIGWRGG